MSTKDEILGALREAEQNRSSLAHDLWLSYQKQADEFERVRCLVVSDWELTDDDKAVVQRAIVGEYDGNRK